MAFDVRRFDIYRKVPKDLTQPTVAGAVISICCCSFIAFLFLSEFFSFISTEIVSELFVDGTVDSEERMAVRVNVTLPQLGCQYVGLDIQDDHGRHEVGFIENTDKHELPGGGCRFEGKFLINRVPGNFHLSTHSVTRQPDTIDMKHFIHEVSFGEEVKNVNIPGSFNTLGGRDKSNADDTDSHEYIMKIVPTVYEPISGKKLSAFQYTYAYRSHNTNLLGRSIPAIWFRYDLTPITVRYHEKKQPFYSFLTTICAIIGGAFTVAGILDSSLFTASELFRKHEIGKLT